MFFFGKKSTIYSEKKSYSEANFPLTKSTINFLFQGFIILMTLLAVSLPLNSQAPPKPYVLVLKLLASCLFSMFRDYSYTEYEHVSNS